VGHFKSCFKVNGKSIIFEVVKMASYFPSLVGNEDNVSLPEEVSKEETLSVLHMFKKYKSPSLDEWLFEFFLWFCDFLGEELLRVIEESMSSTWMLSTFNATFIALIPKSDNHVFFRSIG
jgi:hypothetical protein